MIITTSRRRLFGLLAALALAFAVSASQAAPAHAFVGPASSLDSAFSTSPTALVNALACPAVTAAATTTSDIPGVGVVTDQLKNVVCALNILGYAYRTTYIPANGQPVVRYTRAIALVPTLLDVDGNLLPDFSANVTPSLALNGLTLSINRLLFPATAKVKIEAVLLNPLQPDTYLGLGEDGTAMGTASSWSALVTFFGLSSTTTDLGLSLRANNPPAKLGVIGEIFSGENADQPVKVDAASMLFSPFSNPTTRVRLSAGRQQAIVTNAAPTKLEAHVDVIRPGNHKAIDATADKLPATVDLVHSTQGSNENVTYAAGAPITSLNVHYREREGSSIKTAARLDATNVPAHLTYDQKDAVTTIAAPSGSFGSIEARFANGRDVPDPGAGDGPYASFHRESATKLTGGLRLKNLKSVAIDQSGPYAGRLIFAAPLGPLAFSAKDDVKGLTLTGGLSDLPLDTEVVVDPDNGAVVFNGHGQGISQIVLKATKTTPFFPKVKRIDATVTGIPALETINFKQQDGSVKVAASDPPQTISLLASDGADAPDVQGSYAWFEDTTTRYRAFVRLSGLKAIAFSPEPVGGSIDTAAPQVLNLHAEKGGVTVDGFIDKLPSHVEFTVPGDRVHIENNGAIDHLKLQAKGLPASAKFKNAKVDIFGISPVLDVYLGVRQPAPSPDARAFREPCNAAENPDCELPCDPPTDPDGCEEPPPPPPPPPPVIPDPELFGVDAHGHGVKLITAHAWADDADLALHPDLATNRSAARAFRGPCNSAEQDCDPPCDPQIPEDCDEEPPPPPPVTPPPFPVPDTANAILYDGKTGHEDLRARIANLKHAFYTKNAPFTPIGPFDPGNGTDDIDIEFTQPGDITLGIRKQDKVHGTVTIPQVEGRTLPTRYGLQIGTDHVIQASFRPDAVIPQVDVAMAAGKDEDGERDALIAGTIENIPTETDVCIAKDGAHSCGDFIGNAPGEPTNRSLTHEIDFNLASNGPPPTDPGAMTINARICLDDIGSDAWVPASCLSDQVAKKYVDITNLRLKDLDVEYDDDVSYKYTRDRESMAAYLNTSGVLVDSMKYVKDGGTGVEFIKTGQPLTAEGFFFALNYSLTGRAGVVHGPIGVLSCPPTTELYLLDRDSATGAVSHVDIPGFNNLFAFESLLDVC